MRVRVRVRVRVEDEGKSLAGSRIDRCHRSLLLLTKVPLYNVPLKKKKKKKKKMLLLNDCRYNNNGPKTKIAA